MTDRSTTLRGARVIDPGNGMDSVMDLHLNHAKIVGVGSPPPGFQADQVFDLQGQWVLPGLIDLSVRLREPGFEFKSALESELAAALAGGVSSVVCLPDTDPVLDEPGLVKMLKFRSNAQRAARVFPLGALTVGLRGEVITEMAELAEAGCVGFSMANQALADTNVLLRSMQYANSFGFTLWLSPADPHLSKGGVMHSGAMSTRLGLPGIPDSAEVIGLLTILELVRSTGCRVHLCRLSSARGVEIVRQAKRSGLPISADVCIYNTLLTDADIGFFDSHYRLVPPLRTQRDRDELIAGIDDGTIDAICSDHSPIDDDAKALPFAEAEPGATGLELLLPLALKLVSEAGLKESTVLKALTHGPARVLQRAFTVHQQNSHSQPPQGTLSVGNDADILVFDPNVSWIVSRHSLRSQGKHTPYIERELQGKVTGLWVGGERRFVA